MRGHRGKSGQGRSNRGRQRAPSNTAELFRNTTLMDIAPPKNVEIQADVLDLAELHSTAFWSKVMDIFSLLASKDAPCSACARALQELLEVTSGCPLLISPLAIVLDRALQELCGRGIGADENGIYQAISLSTSTLLPFVATLTLPSSMALAEQLGIPAADMQRQSRALRRAICKQIARMREALNEKALADMVATTPSSRQAPAWPVRVVEVADESLRVVADAGMDEASIRLREESVEVIRKKIERQIAPVFGGDIYVRVFGSTLTGLTHPRSDIDMTVISDNTGDHRKEIRNSIISELKSVELILIALSELERTASMANSCIERFRNIIQEGSQQVSDVDDLAADVEAIQIEDIEYTEPPVQQNQPASMQYFRSIILKKAGAAFKVLHDLYSALEASAAPALEERRQLRISLSSVDQEMLEDKKRLIFRLTRVLRQGGCYEVVPVTEARIGVIHFVDTTPWDKSVPWQCDLVVNQKLGIHNSRLIRAYLEFDSSGKIKQFLRLVKLFAKSHKLNLAPNGLLSSYAWIVLGLIFLLRCEYVPNFQQDLRDVVLCDGINVNFLVPSKIGVALDKLHATLLPDLCLQFFTYLTEQVNICTDVLTMRGKGEVISKTNWSKCPPQWRISIEDPFERADSISPHDLGTTVLMSGQIKIMEALSSVKTAMREAIISGSIDDAMRACELAFLGKSVPKFLKKQTIRSSKLHILQQSGVSAQNTVLKIFPDSVAIADDKAIKCEIQNKSHHKPALVATTLVAPTDVAYVPGIDKPQKRPNRRREKKTFGNKPENPLGGKHHPKRV